jgi:hypothetical protein
MRFTTPSVQNSVDNGRKLVSSHNFFRHIVFDFSFVFGEIFVDGVLMHKIL